MSRWLLDASVLLAREDVEDANHAAARRLLAGRGSVHTLDLALYEVANVAIVAWKDLDAADRLTEMLAAIADDGGLIRATPSLLSEAGRVATEHSLSVYDAAYVAAAGAIDARLVSCDVRDLVSRNLALLPEQAAARGGAAASPEGSP